MSPGLKILTRTGKILYDSTWLAGVYHNDDDNDEDNEQEEGNNEDDDADLTYMYEEEQDIRLHNTNPIDADEIKELTTPDNQHQHKTDNDNDPADRWRSTRRGQRGKKIRSACRNMQRRGRRSQELTE